MSYGQNSSTGGDAPSQYGAGPGSPGKKASVSSYALSSLSSKNSTGKWREVPEIPTSPRLSGRATSRDEARLRDIEAAHLPEHAVPDGGVSSNESQDDLIREIRGR